MSNLGMRINQAGIELIKEFEGLRTMAYQDSVGVWTIGYGHTHSVYPGMHITGPAAEEFLRGDCVIAEDQIKRLVHVPLTANQFSALVSFVFNLGGKAFAQSSILYHLNIGNYEEACRRLARYKYAGGVVLAGLVRRRKAEQELFRTP